MNNYPYTYYPPAGQNTNQSLRDSAVTSQSPSSKTVVYHEPIHMGDIPTQGIMVGNIGPESYGFAEDNDTRQFGFGRGRFGRPGFGRPGFGRPGYGGGFFGPFLLGGLTGAALSRPYYPYPYPYSYPYYPYPYY